MLRLLPFDRQVQERFAGDPPDLRRRARLVAAFGLLGVVGGLTLAVTHVLWFDIAPAFAFEPLIGGCLCFAAIPILLRTRSITAGGHAIAAGWFIAVTWGVLLRGGIAAPPVMCLVGPPYILYAITGHRAATLWLALSLGLQLALLATSQHLVDLMPPAHRGTSNLVASSLFGGLLMMMAFAQEWLRRAAQAELADAERKKLAAEHEAQILRENRLASVGQLAAGLAHEINNPMSYVLANLEHLEQGSLDEDDRQGAIADALEGARRVRTIVRDLKTYSRIDDEALTRVEVEQVISSTLRMVAGETKHRARVRTEIAARPVVLANDTRLGQVLINLVVNAAQAFPGDAGDNQITVALSQVGEHALLEVRDNGPGMPPEVLARVTEPFFTTKPVGVGTGLGLSVSDNLVRRFGGTLAIHSVVGEGTTVSVRLPLAAPAPRARYPLDRLLVAR